MNITEIRAHIQRASNPEKATILQRFFKTGPGEYAEGDMFVGITVPVIRSLARRYHAMPYSIIITLLRSPIHEERLLALLTLIQKYQQADHNEHQKIYELYLKHTTYINNWDLVDLSAPHIVGAFLCQRDKKPLYTLAVSSLLWNRRIAIIATFHYIKQHRFDDTLRITELLLNDTEPLIHKAAGWMLRETGKRNLRIEKDFLKRFYTTMPRTMLRYAIERFPEAERQRYLKGKINIRS